jgi:hypothetical protein
VESRRLGLSRERGTDCPLQLAQGIQGDPGADGLSLDPATFIFAALPDGPVGDCSTKADGWYDDFRATTHEVGYYRDPSGMVYLRGVAIKCGAAGGAVFSLPVGSRPERRAFLVGQSLKRDLA